MKSGIGGIVGIVFEFVTKSIKKKIRVFKWNKNNCPTVPTVPTFVLNQQNTVRSFIKSPELNRSQNDSSAAAPGKSAPTEIASGVQTTQF